MGVFSITSKALQKVAVERVTTWIRKGSQVLLGLQQDPGLAYIVPFTYHKAEAQQHSLNESWGWGVKKRETENQTYAQTWFYDPICEFGFTIIS